ncbi:MAG: tetratricopeptide repeat-containing sensor histidine kinase [Oscillospiraceae bacterium]|jgi:signal transduction histidine kinase|nr:tetratricopeptide repeat-containing sensor histidine kinase [Oscillospiraceae bacterium]
MKNFFAFFMLLVVWQTNAQNDNRAEQYQKMEQQIGSGALSEFEMLQKYDSLMSYYYTFDLIKTRSLFQNALFLAQKTKNIEYEAKFLTAIGGAYSQHNIRDSVLVFFDKALSIIEGTDFYLQRCQIYTNKGSFFRRLSDLENAMHNYLNALEENEKDKTAKISAKQSIEINIRSEVLIISNLSSIYVAMSNVEKALEYLLQGKKIMDDHPDIDFKTSKNAIYTNLAEVYISYDQFEDAFPYIEESYQLAVKSDNYALIVNALARYSKYYRRIGDVDQALKYGKEALQIAEKTNQLGLLNTADKFLMEVYSSSPVWDYKRAIYHAERILDRTPEDDWNSLSVVYYTLGLSYASIGIIDNVGDYFSKYRDATIKISDKNLHNALVEMEVKYETTQKEIEIERQQAEIIRQKSRQTMYMVGLSVAGVLLIMLVYIVILRTLHNRELAESNATKDKFFSIISHDLKNPAIAQLDAIQLLLDYSDQWDTASITNYYKKLLKSARGQVDLLYTLLGWAQLQTKRMPFLPAQFDLVAMMLSCLTLIRDMAENKGIEFVVHLPQTAFVTCDKNMITTVVRNLLTNAVKFTAKEGTVTLDISPCRDATNRVSTRYIVSITDTGTGMSSEQIKNLFRLDRQHSHKGTAGEQGSGLGLIICNELLHKHNSILHVKSEEGRGSRFWFEII